MQADDMQTNGAATAAYYRPTDLAAALSIRASQQVCIAAGCTDLFPATKNKALTGPVLDITAIPELRGVSVEPTGIRIGGATTWSDLLAADLPAAFDGLKLAASEIGSVQIQNAGTIAGNLCTASPAADGVPCLLTLDASVELSSVNGTRLLPLDQFLLGPRQHALQSDDLLTAVLIPTSACRGAGHFQKLGARKYLVISIAMVAVRLETESGLIIRVAISVGSCSPVAVRLPRLEETLTGQSLASAALLVRPDLIIPDLSPIDDIRADQDYRKTAAVELVRRALSELVSSAQQAAA